MQPDKYCLDDVELYQTARALRRKVYSKRGNYRKARGSH
jgi:hypothetical protein